MPKGKAKGSGAPKVPASVPAPVPEIPPAPVLPPAPSSPVPPIDPGPPVPNTPVASVDLGPPSNTSSTLPTGVSVEPLQPMVSVRKDVLDSIIEKSEAQDKKIEMLLAVADKSRLFNLQRGMQKGRPLVVSVSRFEVEGKMKYVVGWTTQMNNVWQDAITRAWREDQQTELIFDDDTKKTIPYLVWVRNTQHVDCEVLSRKTDDHGETLEVLLPEGRKIFIDSRFIN